MTAMPICIFDRAEHYRTVTQPPVKKPSAWEQGREERSRWYREVYLQSEHWKKYRRKTYKKFPYCVWCWFEGKQNAYDLNIAHLSYNDLWHETEKSTAVLCHDHHWKLDDRSLSYEARGKLLVFVAKCRENYKKTRKKSLLSWLG